MNLRQKELQVGTLYDWLEEYAQDLAAALVDMDPMQREARWTRVQGVLLARDKLDWAAKQYQKSVWESKHT